MSTEPWTDPAVIAHCRLMDASHRRWLGQPLLAGRYTPAQLARALYQAPFALVSHGTEADPLFNFANLTAQGLWELDWNAFLGMPSRQSAASAQQTQRAGALEAVSRNGYATGYSGVRVAAAGRRFRIIDTCIWNLLDEDGTYRGQAARFARWEYL